MSDNLITHYFPNLTEIQHQKFAELYDLYTEWNARINVISRKDIDQLYERHVLHSLAITRFTQFMPGAQVLDLGTGGGFPGIPLAIYYPDVQFHLIDGTRKKIQVVQAVSEALDLKNVQPEQKRAEELKGRRYDFVVSRAVARVDKLAAWSMRLLKIKQQHAIPNGLIALKGGDLKAELEDLGRDAYFELVPIEEWFPLPYFDQKYVVYVQG